MQVTAIYISPDHNFFGHYGKPAGTEATVEVNSINCVAGKGIEGDRFFDHKPDYKGQITFFDIAVYEAPVRNLMLTINPYHFFAEMSSHKASI